MKLPTTTLVRQFDTHRLTPEKYRGGEGVLARIADDDRHLQDIFDLDRATDDRLLAESNLLPGIGIHELVFEVPHYGVVNAAFCHAHPLGSRFNGPERGAWYATFEIATAQAEVAFHRWLELSEVDWREEEEAIYDDYLADFSARFHDIRGRAARLFAACLGRDSYSTSQALAERLLEAGSLGIVYPSVRRAKGTCLACFRPALVANVRKGDSYRFRWRGKPKPEIETLR